MSDIKFTMHNMTPEEMESILCLSGSDAHKPHWDRYVNYLSKKRETIINKMKISKGEREDCRLVGQLLEIDDLLNLENRARMLLEVQKEEEGD